MINKLENLLKNLSYIYGGTISINKSFISLAENFTYKPGTILLLSNDEKNSEKHNILGIMPWFSLYGKNKKINLTIDNLILEFQSNPFKTIKYLLKICDIGKIKLDIPIINGFIGYLSYDLKKSLEKIYSTTIDDLHLPDLCLFIPSILLIHNISKNIIRLFILSSNNSDFENKKKYIQLLISKTENQSYDKKYRSYSKKENDSNITYEEYISSVKKIKKFISNGEVYQVNMSHKFKRPFRGNPFSFFKEIYKLNPASFFSYINAGNHYIVSSSPERLIVRKRNKIEVRPIKGTRPRGKSPKKDQLMRNELLKSYKDDSELSMIVDLVRNDLGKVSCNRTIKIIKHKKIETYQNVFHLVSIIQSKLNKNKDSIDIIKAIFPGGSITGCPKIRSMILIDEIEKNKRHIYTGSIGYISFHHSMDLSIAIRTAIIYQSKINFSSGGGIVYDSNPEEEFNETLYKGKNFLNTLGEKKMYLKKQHAKIYPNIWANGIITKLNKSNIVQIEDLGFLYGFGFYETIYMKKKNAYLLNYHIKRFNYSWEKLFENPVPKLSWNKIIAELIEINKVKNQIIKIKILTTKGLSNKKKNFKGSIIILAEKYNKRIFLQKNKGLNISIYPEPRQSPIALYKTLNYLYYFKAGEWAKKNNFDEAIILNPNGTISEGNSSNIFLINGNLVIYPESNFSLPGIMLKSTIKTLKKMNYKVICRSIYPVEILNGNKIYLTNSLIGILPVYKVNNQKIDFDISLSLLLNKKLLDS